ncbi:hypothetical protein [Acinetobacter indicus]|uniref:hypothetical protein n=1 Tax=Acinetobacter indicus TaxID=756892 RepID=UPI000CEC905D|nr:hypothetical protein [Acinetobacter indicus]
MARKIRKQINVVWVDDAISDQSVYLLRKIDVKHEFFLNDFKKMIAEYRHIKLMVDTTPSLNEIERQIDLIQRRIDDLMDDIKLLPQEVQAEIQAYTLEPKAALVSHLKKYKIGLMLANSRIGKPDKKVGGRRKNLTEHKLIYDTYNLLDKHKTKRILVDIKHDFVIQFLTLNGVIVPQSIESTKDIIKIMKKSEKPCT